VLRSITAAQVVEAVRVRAESAAESLKVFTKSFVLLVRALCSPPIYRPDSVKTRGLQIAAVQTKAPALRAPRP
jgi:hypothetical protein